MKDVANSNFYIWKRFRSTFSQRSNSKRKFCEHFFPSFTFKNKNNTPLQCYSSRSQLNYYCCLSLSSNNRTPNPEAESRWLHSAPNLPHSPTFLKRRKTSSSSTVVCARPRRHASDQSTLIARSERSKRLAETNQTSSLSKSRPSHRHVPVPFPSN